MNQFQARFIFKVIVDINFKIHNFYLIYFHIEKVWLAVPIFHPGTLSEYIVVSEKLVSIKPPQITHEAVAALPYSIITAWDALVHQAGLGPTTSLNKRLVRNLQINSSKQFYFLPNH